MQLWASVGCILQLRPLLYEMKSYKSNPHNFVHNENLCENGFLDSHRISDPGNEHYKHDTNTLCYLLASAFNKNVKQTRLRSQMDRGLIRLIWKWSGGGPWKCQSTQGLVWAALLGTINEVSAHRGCLFWKKIVLMNLSYYLCI